MLENLKLKTKRRVDDGLEDLCKVVKCNKTSDTKTVLMGIDGGSTSTRVSVIDFEDSDNIDNYLKKYIIPSTHSEINTSEEIESQSDLLIDNLDSWIVNTIPAPDNVFDKLRVLRATKKDDSNKSTVKIASSEQKVDSPAFYVNLIDAMGYALVQKYADRLPKSVDIYAGFSMRPDDLQGKSNREKFQKRITGKFIWSNKDLGVDYLEINVKGASVQSEPEAALKGNYTLSGEETPSLAVLIEGGGSSFGVEVLQDGVRQKALSRTFEYGGTQLKQSINDRFIEDFGGATLTDDNLETALKTGRIVKGRNVTDVVDIVKDCKDVFAQQILNDIKGQIFDRTTAFKMVDIETFIFSGRIFRPGDFSTEDSNEGAEGYSLTQPLVERIRKLNPQAEFLTLKDNFIPFGNLLLAVSDWGGYLESDTRELHEIENEDEGNVAEE